jgi:hypothetical protein
MERIERQLRESCPGFDFIPSQAAGPDQARQILEEDRQNPASTIHGYLVLQMNCWNQVVQTFATSGKPVLYADFQYGGSGGFLVYNAALLRNRSPNVGFVASSEPADLAEAVRCFTLVQRGGSLRDFVDATHRLRTRQTAPHAPVAPCADDLKCLEPHDCAARIKSARILVIRDQTSGDEPPVIGIPVLRRPFSELQQACRQADREEARTLADRWRSAATHIHGVNRSTLESSAAMYLGTKTLLNRHGATAITVDCIAGFYGGHIGAYPCLGFHQLANDGLIGGCEADLPSAASMVVGNILTQGRPGLMSDPVLDTATRRIIYTHCVASNRPLGPYGPANPFDILSHSEDRQGASVRSFLPPGHLTTTIQFNSERKELLLHQAMTVDNDPDDRACRTKLRCDPLGDFEKLFTHWDRWGWHRVTFYGDLKAPLSALADTLGYRVVQEA